MSIASEITRLSGVRGDIFTSITNKGVTVPVGSTFSSCPSLIDQIEGGGGGPATSLINSGFTASGYVSGYRPFTATQNIVTEKEYEERVESWTGPVTSQASNSILIAVPSASIASFYENNSANNPDKPIQSIINLYYNAQNAGNIRITAYMVPQSNYASEGGNTFFSGSVDIFNPPTSSNITVQMSSIYNVLAANSAGWQWNVQNGTVYIGLQDAWWQFGSSVTELEVSSLYDAVTATTTAYPYPTYPSATTGYITNDITGREFFIRNAPAPFARLVARMGMSGYKNVVYDNSPEGGSTILGADEYYITAFSSNMLKNNITAKTNYNVNSTAYSYNYGTTQTAYSGFEGV